MKKKAGPANDVEPATPTNELAEAIEGAPAADAGTEPDTRRRKRRLVWPLLLAVVMAGSALTIAQAATLPPLPARQIGAEAIGSPASVAPVGAVVPPSGADASAQPAPFGPQLDVILPPPPPPPPPASGKSSSKQRKAAASAAATSGISTDQYCNAKYGATSSASTPQGLLNAANAERANFGLAPLSWSSSLATLAQQWSDAMAAAYTPDNKTAKFYHDMAPNPGGQNLAFYWSSAPPTQATAMWAAHSDPVWGWMVSPDHCKNILRASFTSMGAATQTSYDGLAWFTTVDFQ